MVKILEKSGKERERELKQRMLEKIAREMFSEEYIPLSIGCMLGIFKENPFQTEQSDTFEPIQTAIFITYLSKEIEIDVHLADYFERVKKLAELYESNFSVECTIHIKYS